MPLRSKVFRNDRALEECLVRDAAHIVTGATGPHVSKVQTAVTLLDHSEIDPAEIAGKRYGRSTAAAILAFKSKRGIINRAYQSQADDIVGKMTIAALDNGMFELENKPDLDRDDVCCNGDPITDGFRHAVRNQLSLAIQQSPEQGDFRSRGFQLASAPVTGALGFSAPTFSLLSHFSRLTPSQIATATGVFGTSIDFTFVLLCDISGVSGRAFTVVAGPLLVINCGTFSPPNSTLIHELTHVWQSQHHSDAAEFMRNSVRSQALAVAENEALALVDPTLKTNPKFPSQFPRSPYACITGRPFSEYSAEQIAKQVERNFGAAPGTPIATATDPIVSHIKGVARVAVDADNVTGLKTARTEDKRTAGALF